MRHPLKRMLFGVALTLAVIVTLSCSSAPAIKRASPAPTAPASATAHAPTPTQDPWTTEGLSVQGTQIVTSSGKPITLLGVARFSLEFACQGDGHFQLADFEAMRAWGMNTVRIPLSSAFWRNLDNQCPTYRATVAAAVANAEAAGLYVMLDLQRDAPFSRPQDGATGGAQCPLPDARYDVAFWKQVAALYRDDPRVLFDIFGEPYSIGWYQWWHGGSVTSACYAYPAEYTYTAISMPALAEVVRAAAPRNLIILSGINWGYDLSGVTSQHAVALTNILYGTHPWHHSSIQQPYDWPRAFGATAQHLPVIATEFGAYDCQTGYISTALAYFARLHMSFLAWAWAPGGCATPALITDWAGAPTAPYGRFIQQRMLAVAATNPPKLATP